MLAVVAGAVAAFCLYRQINEQIRRCVETRLAQHYRDLKVSVRSAQLVEGKGIRIYDLSISDPNVEGPAAELLHVEESLFECPTDWKELVKGDPPIRRVTIRRPTIRVTRRPDGTWNLGRLVAAAPFRQHRAGRVLGKRRDRGYRSAEGSREQARAARREPGDRAGAGRFARCEADCAAASRHAYRRRFAPRRV